MEEEGDGLEGRVVLGLEQQQQQLGHPAPPVQI